MNKCHQDPCPRNLPEDIVIKTRGNVLDVILLVIMIIIKIVIKTTIQATLLISRSSVKLAVSEISSYQPEQVEQAAKGHLALKPIELEVRNLMVISREWRWAQCW